MLSQHAKDFLNKRNIKFVTQKRLAPNFYDKVSNVFSLISRKYVFSKHRHVQTCLTHIITILYHILQHFIIFYRILYHFIVFAYFTIFTIYHNILPYLPNFTAFHRIFTVSYIILSYVHILPYLPYFTIFFCIYHTLLYFLPHFNCTFVFHISADRLCWTHSEHQILSGERFGTKTD
jgi:hypothetical protein